MNHLKPYIINQPNNPKRFYIYLWYNSYNDLDKDTPYYCGRGTKTRCLYQFRKSVAPPKDRNLIRLVAVNMTIEEADKLEIQMIQKYGREVDGGTLKNNCVYNHGLGKGYKIGRQSVAHRKAIGDSIRAAWARKREESALNCVSVV